MKNEQSRRPMKCLSALTLLLLSLSSCTDLPPTRSPIELYRPHAQKTPVPALSPPKPEALDVSLENARSLFEKALKLREKVLKAIGSGSR
jgi:hypothetical protein